MNPKKKIRMQKALARRQIELQNWIDGTARLFNLPPENVKTKIAIAERDIASLKEKLGHELILSS